MLNASEFRDETGAIDIVTNRDIFVMGDSVNWFPHFVVVSVECLTGDAWEANGHRRRGVATGTVLLAFQSRPEVVLVLHLKDVYRIDVRNYPTSRSSYGDAIFEVDEKGFRIEFPDGALIWAGRARYRIVSLDAGGDVGSLG